MERVDPLLSRISQSIYTMQRHPQNNQEQPPPPEQLYYDTMEQYFHNSIRNTADFLFDTVLFDQEIKKLWEKYNIPCSVCKSLLF